MTEAAKEGEMRASLEQFMVPSRLYDGIVRYVMTGIRPGGFLSACIMNNFTDALLRADDDMDRDDLEAIAKWLHNEAPSACWGSHSKMGDWITARSAD